MLKSSLPSLALLLSLTLLIGPGQASESPFPADLDESLYVPPQPDDGLIPEWVGTRDDEPFDVRAYLESRRPPEKNAAPLYIYAMSRYLPDFDYLYPEEEQEAYWKRTNTFSNRVANLCDLEYREEHNVTAAEIEALLVEARPLMELIDAAQERSECVFSVQPSMVTKLPFAQQARTIVRLSQLEVEQACARKDFVTAANAIQRSYRMARDLRARGPMISQLVSMAIDGLMAQSIFQHYLSHPDLTVADSDRLLKILDEHRASPINMADEGVKFEYVIYGSTIVDFELGKPSASEIVDSEEIPKFPFNFEIEWQTANSIYGTVLSMIQSLKNDGRLGAYYDAQIQQLQRDGKERMGSTWFALGVKLGMRKFDFPVLVTILAPAFNQLAEACRRREVRLNAVIMLAAVRRYQIEHGRLPETLEAAAQEAGYHVLPIDLYDPDGHELRYVILNGKPIVYSVGSDGVDDGGLVDWEFRHEGDFLFQLQ